MVCAWEGGVDGGDDRTGSPGRAGRNVHGEMPIIGWPGFLRVRPCSVSPTARVPPQPRCCALPVHSVGPPPIDQNPPVPPPPPPSDCSSCVCVCVCVYPLRPIGGDDEDSDDDDDDGDGDESV